MNASRWRAPLRLTSSRVLCDNRGLSVRCHLLALVLAGALAWAPAASAEPRAAQASTSPQTDELARARALDKEGAKAYAEGRYRDAIRYFEEAHRLGGPPFELWNIARCHIHLDQPEKAAELLDRYLETPGLAAADRAEATRQLEELRGRASPLTIASQPPGARVEVDGRSEASRTPMSTSVSPGTHVVRVSLAGHAPFNREIVASYGRAVIVDAPLTAERAHRPPDNPYAQGGSARAIVVRGAVGVVFPRFAGAAGSAEPVGILSGTVRVADVRATRLSVGVLGQVSGDSWRSTLPGANVAAPCGTLQGATSATSLSLFALGSAGWELVPRLRAHALFGLGLATQVSDQAGGDVFAPTCRSSPGLQPAALVGGVIDYALTDAVRLTAIPFALQLQSSLDGARQTPVDATGLWTRTNVALGVGVEL